MTPNEKRELCDLEALLEYELDAGKRYRRFVSLVSVGPLESDPQLPNTLQRSVRKCDRCFNLSTGHMVLFGETQQTQAIQAVDRLKGLFSRKLDLRFGIASCPEDGWTATDLISIATRRMNDALMEGPGSVKSTG